MPFLDRQSRFFRSFRGRIRGFRLPIHLEAESAAVPRRVTGAGAGAGFSGTGGMVMVLVPCRFVSAM